MKLTLLVQQSFTSINMIIYYERTSNTLISFLKKIKKKYSRMIQAKIIKRN